MWKTYDNFPQQVFVQMWSQSQVFWNFGAKNKSLLFRGKFPKERKNSGMLITEKKLACSKTLESCISQVHILERFFAVIYSKNFNHFFTF